jgi:2-desacetyl-2-hydroxyethyl bacteriochlorophyllide A dehydrogenase
MPANPTVVFTAPRQVEVQDVPVPEPGPGTLLIRTRCTLISTGTELSCLDGTQPRGRVWSEYGSFPSRPGYSNVGTVVEAGEGVDGGWVGKRVASWGGHGAYVTAGLGQCKALDEAVPDEDAAFATLGIVALNGVRRGQPLFGESAVVYGLGIVGNLAAQICAFAGALPVIGVDLSEKRLSLLPDLPGVVAVDASAADVPAAVEAATDGRKADIVYECTGNGNLIPKEMEVLRRQGRIVIVSSPLTPTHEFDFHDLCNSPSLTIIGAHNFSHPPYATPDSPWTMQRDTDLFFDLLEAGRLKMSHLISHRQPVEEAPALYRMLLEDRGSAMGVILTWQ